MPRTKADTAPFGKYAPTGLARVAGQAASRCSTGWFARRLGFDKADEITIVFCGSKKSLASGIPMANILFAGQGLGLIVLPVMLFHQIQLFVCATMAQRYAARPKSGP